MEPAPSPPPPAEERATQLQAFDAVRSLLQARFPGARVHLFGSVANGLSVRHNNDIDVCLELEEVAGDDQVRDLQAQQAGQRGQQGARVRQGAASPGG